ncbi:ST3 beta-galactoside alpha-2,3-sialyltransferase 7 isoform X2 [Salvelinus fontinalis]|uniref:ST3 beta-galactoside alpha-2,3-sialyltransferase 7 isoform X2 n=1 Tax=Salvelinus fontinalis TaxID=8038 RepID=UPI0024852017|nr:ST3 beta-galactoside alpha-2,3-sialyltransferase 7 isoform X2 [Salvelinus fontinalis]
MVTLKHLSVEEPDDYSSPDADFSEITPVTVTPDTREMLLSRTNNLALSLVLLVGCYSAILVPALITSDPLSGANDNQHTDMPCHPGWCVSHLLSLDSSLDLQDIPVFLQSGIAADRRIPWDLAPPLGLQGCDESVARALASLTHPGLPPSLEGRGRGGGCRRCVVVGSGGVLHGSHLGSHIDQYDVIIRMNNAPVSGFERDAGSRTTVRLMYPEGAPLSPNEYRHTSLVTLVVYKCLDLDWLTSVITKQPLSWWSKLWFWRDVVENIPLKPENIQILNPEIMHKTGLALQRYTQQQRKLVPTLGASAVVMALQLCDEVSLAGFGYDLQHLGARLHYYESLRMDAIKAQVVHDVSAEKLFLRELVAAGVLTDLTGAL